MLTREELLHMRNMSFDDVNPDEIPDIKDLDIDVTKSKEEKILKVLESGRNPYFVRSGNILVKIGFASTSRTIEEALESPVLKREWLNRFRIIDHDHAYKLIFEYINTFYNTVRSHSHCGYISPQEYENKYLDEMESSMKKAG